MRIQRFAAIVCLVVGLILGFSAVAHAQATRTWVSGVGDDVNPCSRTAPCKTFAGAISKTAPGGEIDCLDSGGFGALTITKGLTIDCKGVIGGVLFSGTNGIIVAAGGGDVVTLRGLDLNGAGTGINAIRYLSGLQLIVEDCDIYGVTHNGIDVQLAGSGTLLVRRTHFSNILTRGVEVDTSSGSAIALIADSTFTAIWTGVESENNSFTTVTASRFLGNVRAGAAASANGVLNVDDSTISNSAVGILVTNGTVVRASNNSLYDNGTAFSSAGVLVSAGSNRIAGVTDNPNYAMTIK
jgi:hypothetical protein